jgi:sugar phosphate isomerase/epimerase
MSKAVSEVRLGIFAKTFARSSPEGVFDALATHDLRETQFNMSVTGLSSMPDEIAPALADRVREAAAKRNITVAAVSGTFNMAHPDEEVRRDGLRRLGVIAGACQRLGTSVIALCTGTRDEKNMWRRHPTTGHQRLCGICSPLCRRRSPRPRSTASPSPSSQRRATSWPQPRRGGDF